jgi:hypothetical protein
MLAPLLRRSSTTSSLPLLTARNSGVRPALSPERVRTVIFWSRNPTKTLGFLLPWISWFSAFSPTLCTLFCTVVSEKTKLSCFGGFFLGFFNLSNCLVFLENGIITFYLYLIKVEHSKEDIETYQ